MIKVLFIGKKDDYYAELAAKRCKNKNIKLKALFVNRNNKDIFNNINWEGEYIISYLCPLLIPSNILKKAKILALNFHPGPPEYPGIGCTNYAIYNEDSNYGATCHIMSEKIDDGEILEVKRFKIRKNENLYSLTMNTYKNMYGLYLKILGKIIDEKEFKISKKSSWKGEPKTRKEFLSFLKLSTNMSNSEIKKRIFSTTYPGFEPAQFNIKGIKFFGNINE
jgi:methionyl-tRNA formyltransferase